MLRIGTKLVCLRTQAWHDHLRVPACENFSGKKLLTGCGPTTRKIPAVFEKEVHEIPKRDRRWSIAPQDDGEIVPRRTRAGICRVAGASARNGVRTLDIGCGSLGSTFLFTVIMRRRPPEMRCWTRTRDRPCPDGTMLASNADTAGYNSLELSRHAGDERRARRVHP